MRAQILLPGLAGTDKPALRSVDVYPLKRWADDHAARHRPQFSARVYERSIKVDTLDVCVWVLVVREKARGNATV